MISRNEKYLFMAIYPTPVPLSAKLAMDWIWLCGFYRHLGMAITRTK